MESSKEVKIEKWAVAVMLILGILFYFVPGKWISIESDSASYFYPRGVEGVLPGYPIFLDFFRFFLGEEMLANGAVVGQCVLAIACTFIFVIALQKQFRLRGFECILLYLVSMLPFSIYLPEVGITHQIMTEGITYSLFYLFFAAVLKAVWTKKIQWYGVSFLIAYVLAFTRSQMIFLQIICLLLLLWIVWKKSIAKPVNKVAILTVAAIVGTIMAFFTFKSIYAFDAYYDRFIVEKRIDGEIVEPMTEVKPEVSQNASENDGEEFEAETQGEGNPIDKRKATSQFDTLIIARGMFEADKEDASLFKDETVRDIFLRTYELADEGEHLYKYAESGLYMWEDLVYDRMPTLVYQAIEEYDKENPGVRTKNATVILREIGLTILFEHVDRYIYHAIRLMMPSFIAAVFFQIRPIYLLCHFIALFIYIFAIAGAVWIKKHRGSQDVCNYVSAIVTTIIIMVVVINMVFTGLQRYVVYGMGIYYCAMYLQMKEIYFIVKAQMQKRKTEICRRGIEF